MAHKITDALHPTGLLPERKCEASFRQARLGLCLTGERWDHRRNECARCAQRHRIDPAQTPILKKIRFAAFCSIMMLQTPTPQSRASEFEAIKERFVIDLFAATRTQATPLRRIHNASFARRAFNSCG
jgi:hypothetical protein